jgi:dimethylargininase
MDGGDVLVAGRDIYIGASARTNGEAIEQVEEILRGKGYRVRPVPVSRCLHLKSAATLCAEEALLVNPAWVDPARFGARTVIEVDPSEPYGANGLRIGAQILYPAAFPRTRERLQARGAVVRTIDLSELAKAEGAVTCCSLVFET